MRLCFYFEVMSIVNLFKIALRAIAANKLRSFLTMLGIIIGVASVITMLAIGQGSKKSIQLKYDYDPSRGGHAWRSAA